MNLQTLKTELASDPLDRGYDSMDDVSAAESLNTEDRQADRESLDTGLLVASLVDTEYVGLGAVAKDYLALLASAQSVPLTATVKTNLGRLFPAGSETRANLIALLKRPGSRADELGLGRVTPSHVADARRLP